MTDPTPHQQVLAAIEAKKAEAVILLKTATHESLKKYARLAAQDLDEALVWLNNGGSVRIATLTVEIAIQRLAMVKVAIDVFGPDAAMMDMGRVHSKPIHSMPSVGFRTNEVLTFLTMAPW